MAGAKSSAPIHASQDLLPEPQHDARSALERTPTAGWRLPCPVVPSAYAERRSGMERNRGAWGKRRTYEWLVGGEGLEPPTSSV